MAKMASTPVSLPKLKLPKVDLDALLTVQKANLATMQEAQSLLVEAAQAVTRLQHGWVEETVANAQDALKAAPKKPETVLAEIKAGAEKAATVVKQGLELTVTAQRRVVELFARRAQANVDALKVLAA